MRSRAQGQGARGRSSSQHRAEAPHAHETKALSHSTAEEPRTGSTSRASIHHGVFSANPSAKSRGPTLQELTTLQEWLTAAAHGPAIQRKELHGNRAGDKQCEAQRSLLSLLSPLGLQDLRLSPILSLWKEPLTRRCVRAKPALPKQLTALKPRAPRQPRCSEPSRQRSPQRLGLVISVSAPLLEDSAPTATQRQALWVNTPL